MACCGVTSSPVVAKLHAVLGDEAERPVRVELEDVDGLLLDVEAAVGLPVGPGRLDAERGLEVGLGRLQGAEHEDRAPLADRHAGHQLAARQRDGAGPVLLVAARP